MEFNMPTKDNLAAAFAGESQANRKYLAFAKKAETDGFPAIAKLFRAAAAAETVHAHAHLRAMQGIHSTAENIQAGIDGEGFEFQNMYPPYLKEAQQAGDIAATKSFEHAMKVEEIHYNLYREAKTVAEKGKDLPNRKLFVCQVCGNTVYDEAQDKCSVCGANKTQFAEVE
jgi:rubrerythrin